MGHINCAYSKQACSTLGYSSISRGTSRNVPLINLHEPWRVSVERLFRVFLLWWPCIYPKNFPPFAKYWWDFSYPFFIDLHTPALCRAKQYICPLHWLPFSYPIIKFSRITDTWARQWTFALSFFASMSSCVWLSVMDVAPHLEDT